MSIRAGVARQLIDLMERGLVTHIGMNGAGPIHDYELARIGATCESVARYIRSGEFGLWRETGEMNDIVRAGAADGHGPGRSARPRTSSQGDFPHKDSSVLAAGVRLGVPVTVHIGIGYDILHEHPNFDPAAFGTASYRDFLAVCHTVDQLEGGVFLCMGSAVMGPEVYLKALAMARNVAHQEGRQIANFTTAAFDLIPIDGDWQAEAPKTQPAVLLPPLEDDPRPHRRRRRRELLRLRRPPADDSALASRRAAGGSGAARHARIITARAYQAGNPPIALS